MLIGTTERKRPKGALSAVQIAGREEVGITNSEWLGAGLCRATPELLVEAGPLRVADWSHQLYWNQPSG